MRPTIFVSFSVCMMLAASQLHASTETHPLEPSAPRTVTVSEADTPPQIRAGLLQSTLLVLPNEEKVANVFAGDTVNWIFDGGHVASRFISVKPKTANAVTDIHVVSDHGNEYTLALREVSDDSDPHFDSKVFIAPGDQAAKDRLAQLPVFVPVAELDKAKQEAVAAKAAQEAELKAEATKAEQYRSEYRHGRKNIPRRFLLLTLGRKESCGSVIKTCKRGLYTFRSHRSRWEVLWERVAAKPHRVGHLDWALFLIGITFSLEFIRQIANAQPTYELSRALLGSLDRDSEGGAAA